jgi:hypothetical protein
MATTASAITNPHGLCVDCGAPATGTAGTDGYCDGCGAKRNARKRQAIPVITNAATPEVNVDTVEQIIKLLDGALALYEQSKALTSIVTGYYQVHCERLVALFADRHPEAEYTYRLWASAHGFEIEEWIHDSYGYRKRMVGIVVAKDHESSVTLATLHAEDVPPIKAAGNDEQPVADVTPAAIREALANPHWTDDKATSLDGNNNEVITTPTGDRP